MGALIVGLRGAPLIIFLVMSATAIPVIVDVLARPTQDFVTAGKMTKGIWLMFLALGLLVPVVAIGAAIFYFLDARPALDAVGGSKSK